MRVMWTISEGLVKDVIAELPKPAPPYNTISSIIRILEEKGYLSHKAYGRTHVYFPIVSEDEFRKNSFRNLILNYFDGSVENVVSFMVKSEDLGEAEIQRIRKIIDAAEKEQKEESND